MKFKHRHLPFPPENPSWERSQRSQRRSQQHCPDQVSLRLVWAEQRRLLLLPALSLLLFLQGQMEVWHLRRITTVHEANGNFHYVKAAKLTVSRLSGTQGQDPAQEATNYVVLFRTSPLASKDFHKWDSEKEGLGSMLLINSPGPLLWNI